MFIINCNKKHEPNWSGKEWSILPCKIYTYYEDAASAIARYWYNNWHGGRETYDHRQIIVKPLTERRAQQLIQQKKARL